MLLGAVNYDPAVAVSKATSALLAMTAFDTTNARIAFTVPANGSVMVRIRCTLNGATTMPSVLLGVLEGATVRARVAPAGGLPGTAATSTNVTQEALFVVSGLTPGANLTWDAAYGVETLLAATNIRYGGPNDATANNAWGGLQFEVWEADGLLGAKLHDPAAAATFATSALLAMTAFDTTNLRLVFTPTTSRVLVRIHGTIHGATTFPQVLLGVLEGATVRGRVAPIGALTTTAVATSMLRVEGTFIVTGLTPGNSLTWDAAYGVETLVAATAIKAGGPNDAVANNAFGGLGFELWAA